MFFWDEEGISGVDNVDMEGGLSVTFVLYLLFLHNSNISMVWYYHMSKKITGYFFTVSNRPEHQVDWYVSHIITLILPRYL